MQGAMSGPRVAPSDPCLLLLYFCPPLRLALSLARSSVSLRPPHLCPQPQTQTRNSSAAHLLPLLLVPLLIPTKHTKICVWTRRLVPPPNLFPAVTDAGGSPHIAQSSGITLFKGPPRPSKRSFRQEVPLAERQLSADCSVYSLTPGPS